MYSTMEYSQKIDQLVTDENVLLPTTDFHQVLNAVRSVRNRAFYDVVNIRFGCGLSIKYY